MKEWTAPDSGNTPLTTNIAKEEIVDALGNDGNASIPEKLKRRNPWRKIIMMNIPPYPPKSNNAEKYTKIIL